MSLIFLATIGQRPEAVTIALDQLMADYHYAYVGLLHTDPQQSRIGEALSRLQDRLKAGYPQLPLRNYNLCASDGAGIIDITDSLSAENYYLAVLQILHELRSQGDNVHLLVAGGRKAMSIYATLAASVVFGELDRVWTVLTAPHLMQEGVFHLEARDRINVQMVAMPLVPSRKLPGTLAELDLDRLNASRNSPRTRFLSELSKEEARLIENLRISPYSTNQQLAEKLKKSHRTIENQLRSIYGKLESFYDIARHSEKRQLLVDVLLKRI